IHMRLSRSDVEQNGRAALICKAYAKRGLALLVASDQCFIGRCEIFDFTNVPRMGFCCSVLGRIAQLVLLSAISERRATVSSSFVTQIKMCPFLSTYKIKVRLSLVT